MELASRVPGKNWVACFLMKHRSIVQAANRHGLDPKQEQAFNPMTVGEHFTLLAKVIDKYRILLANIYNWDEKGIQLGRGCKGLQGHYVFGVEDREQYVAHSDSVELVLLLEAMSVDRLYIPPTFVVPKLVPPGWPLIFFTDWASLTSVDSVRWFLEIFIPHVSTRNISGEWVLLTFDRHHSHETPEMLDEPSTMLQLLDMSVFGPLKTAWSRHTQRQA
ncbi:hypothetical protein K439DRAFT_1646254 [Ramaria rubella]|nr:hypothetical protein K439DRAFT_1646254 [Ramaria rubella]